MAEERRFGEEEVRRIFEIASSEGDAAERRAGQSGALTLAELQEIGREVGIPPDRIERAASSLAQAQPPQQRSSLGVPVAVRHSVPLPRAPTEQEWGILVSHLRETFQARGQLSGGGGFYEWSNGNLHVFIEPTGEGYRLRMGTRKESAMITGGMGLAALGWGAAVFVGMAITGDLAQEFIAPALASLLGAGTVGATVVRLPGWARTRRRQMEEIAARAQALLGAPKET